MTTGETGVLALTRGPVLCGLVQSPSSDGGLKQFNRSDSVVT